MRWTFPCWLAIAICAGGCSEDFKQIADEHVQNDMLDKHEKQDAIAFLENDGHFYDDEDAEGADETSVGHKVDHEIVLPLLKRLKDLSSTDQWAMIRPENAESAYGILIGLPGDESLVDQMATAVQEADDKFSGFILQQWGHDWLLIDFIDEHAYATIKRTNPDIDKQR